MEDKILLKIVTPAGEPEAFGCDSVILPVCDDKNGRGGGNYGIRRGHAKALFALGKGRISAKKDGEEIFSVYISSGFATADRDTVTVTVEKFEQ